MADIENLQTEVRSSGKEQIEQHVEEEIVHELVSSGQSWRLDADETAPSMEVVPDEEEDEEDDHHDHDEPGQIITIDGGIGPIIGDPDDDDHHQHDQGGEGDDSYDGHGVFFLESEEEVKQKVSAYEKNTGTHFIMLKKEKGYSQTAEVMASASDNLIRHGHPSGETSEEFSCDECEMVYKNYKSLWQHKRDNHQDKLSCGYCDYVSSRMYNIKQHRKRRHPNMPDPFDANVSDLFHGAYPEDSRFEYQPEEDLDSGEPLPKIANMSRRNFNFAEASDIPENPGMQPTFVHGNSEERQMHQRAITTTAYPVGLTTSREPFNQSGSHLRQPQSVRSQAFTSTPKRADGNLTTTSSTLPRITSVTGSQVLNNQLNRTPTSPKVNFIRMQSSASSGRESTSFHAPPVNSHPHRRECQEGMNRMDDRPRTSPITRVNHQPGNHQQIHTQNTNSSLGDENSRNTSSSQTIVRKTTYHNPSQESILRGTSSTSASACNNSRNTGQNNTVTSVLINRDSEKQKRQSILGALTPTRSNSLSVDRQLKVSSDASKGARQQPSKIPQQDAPPQGRPSPSPVESTRVIKPTSCPRDPQPVPRPKPQTSVRSVINEHRQEVGLTDFRSLLKNFHVRSITERVVHPDEWKLKRLNWSQKSRATVPIAFDGTPFMYLGQVLLSCQHGKDKNIGIKKKYREKAALRSLNKEDDYMPTKRLLSPSTKKMGCPALISVKKVVKFPDFMVPINSSSHTKRKKFQEVAAAMKQSPEKLNAEMRFYLKIPSSSEHKNHPPVVCSTPGKIQPKKRTMALNDVVKASSRIASLINLTPIHTSSTVDRLCGRSVYFKAELMQKTGSFKVRGALNAILSLKESGNEPKGVVTHSSGNHGQALAYAAQLTGVPCVVVVPHDTPAVKVQAILQYQAEVVFSQPTQASRKDTCEKVRKARDYHFVSPYDDVDVIAGQGTLGLEMLDQCPYVQAILIPTSGGGLAGGIATAVKGINKNVKIYCVEPEGKDLQSSLQAGRRLWPDPPQSLNTVADAIRTQQLGKLTWPILRDKAEKEVFTVNDVDIVEAMKFAWTRLKLLIEPAAATGVAAVLSEKMKKLDPSIQHVAVVLCGGNVDIERLPWEQKTKPDFTSVPN